MAKFIKYNFDDLNVRFGCLNLAHYTENAIYSITVKDLSNLLLLIDKHAEVN